MSDKTKLNCLSDNEWQDLKNIIIFGIGRQGKKMFQTLADNFNILAIIDNDEKKIGTIYQDYKIKRLDDVAELIKETKIIVTTSQYYYKDIRKQLEGKGLVENIDFVMYQQFITEWFYKYQKKIYLLKTDISLTTRCTLNCKNCMQFLPYWDEVGENSLESIDENLECYFDCVDYLFDLDIVGGEPFLYSKLYDFVELIGRNYRDKIGYVGFITNGTIVPKDEVLELMSKYNFQVSITDYSQNITYKHRIPELIKKLEQYGITYMRNINIDWFDFGFPEKKYCYDDKYAVTHMAICNSIEHVLDNQRLYYCGLEWSAQKGKLFEDEEKAYIDLQRLRGRTPEERKQILEMILGNIEGGYLEFCKYCGGFGIDNNNRVNTAEQMPRRK
ncbi:radical SAM protein [Butyrivibrio sp. YAB3001]|uniref:radical SAM protein n=1 Tax=Butyrivibrio sp. YAB3001 TaxID=1520812 RepID=UPI0008F63733|nr:radical SAM protein [Butyrivibrio sp. YAB3001]SFC94489.1 Radical SAM superfamily protein [Butyrivibrio sp. YAB3001]